MFSRVEVNLRANMVVDGCCGCQGQTAEFVIGIAIKFLGAVVDPSAEGKLDVLSCSRQGS